VLERRTLQRAADPNLAPLTAADIETALAYLNSLAGAALHAKDAAKANSIARKLGRTKYNAEILALVKEWAPGSKAAAKKADHQAAHKAAEQCRALYVSQQKELDPSDTTAFCGAVYLPTGKTWFGRSSTLVEADANAGFHAFVVGKTEEDDVLGRSRFSCAEPAVANKAIVESGVRPADVAAFIANMRFFTVNIGGKAKEPCENCKQWVKTEP
jgi:hypothetical protein